MADTTSLVASARFRNSNTMAAEMQVWYRALNVGTLKHLVAVENGDYVRLVLVYTVAG